MEIPGYKILGTVGQGGMALVYEAIQNSLHRKVALKVLSPALVADEEFCQRFLEEGKTVARLSHQNIVTIYDIGHHENQYFMSMEFINGGNLRSRIDAGMDEEDVVRVARQIARALGYAHDHGFLHRDVKPHNILFREDGVAVLSDFGIAKNLSQNSELTRTGKSLGSPIYMSPEQIRNETLDVRSDLYSLGVVIYQMLTGYAPYLASTAESTTKMHLSCPVPDLPPELSKFQPLIRRLLAKRRNNRFLNAWELIESLDAITSGETQDLPGQTSNFEMEKTIAMPASTQQFTTGENEDSENPRGPESTQELDDTEVAQAIENPKKSRIYATRDEVEFASTQEQTAIPANPVHNKKRSKARSLKLGLLSALVLAGVLIFPQLRDQFVQRNAGNSVEDHQQAGVSIKGQETVELPESKPNDLKIAFGNEPAEVIPAVSEPQEIPAQASVPEPETNPESEIESGEATLASLSSSDDAIAEVMPAPVISRTVPEKQAPEKQTPEIKEPAPVTASVPAVVNETVVSVPSAPADNTVESGAPVSSQVAAAVAFESLRDPGLAKVNGEYWISHELENILRRNGLRIFRLGDGSLSISLPQNDLFSDTGNTFAGGATEKLDQLSYVLRNYSGFTVAVTASTTGFGAQQIMDSGTVRAEQVVSYLRNQMNDPQRLTLEPAVTGSNVDGGSVEFRLLPVPIL